jgi:hypothetical protein
MPLVCAVAATSSVAWGGLTTFGFAPAGGLFSLATLAEIRHHGLLFALGSLGILAAAVVGLVLGLQLIGLVHVLAVRTPGSAERVRRVAYRSLAHHVAVATALAYWFASAGDFDMYGFAVLPCAIGIGHAMLLGAAYRVLDRLDLEDRRREATRGEPADAAEPPPESSDLYPAGGKLSHV